jgi:hypothetical protein
MGGSIPELPHVAKSAREIGVTCRGEFSNVGAALFGRSLQLERRL